MELSSYVLELPNNAKTTLSQNVIGCSKLSQQCCKLIGQYWRKREGNSKQNMRPAAMNILKTKILLVWADICYGITIVHVQLGFS